MRKLLFVILFTLVLTACNSAFNEYMEEADSAFLDGDFPNALTNYELALDEKTDNEEVLGKIDLLEEYFYLLDLVEEAKWEESQEIVVYILNDEYIEESLTKEVEKLQTTIDAGLDNDQKVTAGIDKIAKLLDKEDVEKATKEIKQLKKKFDVTNFSKELKDMDKNVDITKEIIAEKERKKKEEEEEKRKAQLAQTKNEFLNKATAIENDIKIKWENSTETSTSAVGALIHDDYEKWEALMNEVLNTIEKNISENDYNNLMNEQNNWAQERDKKSDELYNNYEELGLMASNEGADHLLRKTEERTYHLINTYF